MNILSINLLNTTPIRKLAFRQTAPNNVYSQIPKQDEFVRNTGSLDIRRIKALNMSHFRLHPNETISAVTLANKNPAILTELKECGIENVIDFRPEGSEESKYAQDCKKNGLNYINFKIRDNMPVFNAPCSGKMSSEERRVAIEKFVHQLSDFFGLMDKGKNFMACLLGLHRTDLAATMNYLLNPNEPKMPPVLAHMFYPDEINSTNKYIGKVKNVLKNLNQKDKKFLNIPENFSDIFDSRVIKLRLVNRAK